MEFIEFDDFVCVYLMCCGLGVYVVFDVFFDCCYLSFDLSVFFGVLGDDVVVVIEFGVYCVDG